MLSSFLFYRKLSNRYNIQKRDSGIERKTRQGKKGLVTGVPHPLLNFSIKKEESYISEMEKGIDRNILFYTTRNTTSRVAEKNSHRK